MEVRRNPPSKCIYRKHVLDGARYVTQVTRNRGFSPPVEERRPDERARWWIVSEGIHATRLCNACFRDDHGSSSPKEPALSPPKIESYEFSTFHHFRRPSLPRKRNFEKRVTLPPGPIPGEFFEIAPLSRLIHPICSSSLCDLFLSSTASPKLVNIGHLRKKQVWKQAFSNEPSFFSAT